MSENIQSANTASLSSFGRAFQEKLLQALLVDRSFAEQMLEVFDVNYLDLKYLKFLADKYFAYAKKYKVFPTLPLLVTIIRDELKVGTDVILRDQIVELLTRFKSNPDMGDLQYVKEKALEFCKKQALRAALEHAVDQIQAEKYESIVEEIKKAVMVGNSPALGHDFFEDYEARFTKLQRNAVPTGLEEIDKKEILNGGLGAGECGIIVGNAGGGKCTIPSTVICINYCAIIINNVSYKPWDKISTKRGLIYAKDIIESDELI